MKPFPDIYELIGVFESEPIISDKDIPWFYSSLKFLLSRGTEILECEIEPSYNSIKIKWFQNNRQLLNLTLEDVKGIEIEKRPNKEILHIYFDENHGVNKLILQLKPQIYISWGTERNH